MVSGGGSFDKILAYSGSKTATADITDLTPLRALRYLNGDLIVYDSDELKNLEGPEGIQRVGGIARLALQKYQLFFVFFFFFASDAL